RGVEASDELAVSWFRRAAKENDPPALDHLAWMLKQGKGCERDDAEALRLFKTAALARHHQARFNLGVMLKEGRGLEAPDELNALVWLSLAARVGHEGAIQARNDLEARVSPELKARANALMRER
ncbi:MAG: tetratricopeptide repeat protein, partial [Planctomycetota bacterium]|nr:tetratricopeptide repeat protein [Planctomycetota bacterium]